MNEEKGRYIYTKIDGYYWIKDTETNENYSVNKCIIKLLNQQNERIIVLQELRLADSTKQHNDLLACYEILNSLRIENQRLKQELEKLRGLK